MSLLCSYPFFHVTTYESQNVSLPFIPFSIEYLAIFFIQLICRARFYNYYDTKTTEQVIDKSLLFMFTFNCDFSQSVLN